MSWGHLENRSEGHQLFRLCSLRCSFPIDLEASVGYFLLLLVFSDHPGLRPGPPY